jgi:hypothetical protein
VFGSGNFDTGAGPCGVVMDELALALICLRVFRFSTVSSISLIYRTHCLNTTVIRRTRGRCLATLKKRPFGYRIASSLIFKGESIFFHFISVAAVFVSSELKHCCKLHLLSHRRSY